jgi:hypothetical protein
MEKRIPASDDARVVRTRLRVAAETLKWPVSTKEYP